MFMFSETKSLIIFLCLKIKNHANSQSLIQLAPLTSVLEFPKKNYWKFLNKQLRFGVILLISSFVYDENNGELKINLLYDDRQHSTDRLKTLGITINNNLSGYEALKAKYDSAIIIYNQQTAELQARNKAYSEKLSAYNSQVNYWNSRGGAPKDKANQLEKEKIALENERKAIIQLSAQVNSQVDDINAMGTALNQMAADLNINAQIYNGIVANQEDEFQEGHYRKNNLIQEINIYQFNDRNMLTRVLMHELGHALGLEHLENPEAIMYRLNQATNLYLTEDDLSALKTACQIK